MLRWTTLYANAASVDGIREFLRGKLTRNRTGVISVEELLVRTILTKKELTNTNR
jgi:hypothetical protein